MNKYSFQEFLHFRYLLENEVEARAPQNTIEKLKTSISQGIMSKIGDAALSTTPGLIGNILKHVFEKGGGFLRKLFISLPEKPSPGASPQTLKNFELADRRRDEEGQKFGVMTKLIGGIATSAFYYSLMF